MYSIAVKLLPRMQEKLPFTTGSSDFRSACMHITHSQYMPSELAHPFESTTGPQPSHD